MEQRPVTQFHFTDCTTGSAIYAAIRVEGAAVALVLSSRDDGDIAVALDRVACVQLAEALQQAATRTQTN